MEYSIQLIEIFSLISTSLASIFLRISPPSHLLLAGPTIIHSLSHPHHPRPQAAPFLHRTHSLSSTLPPLSLCPPTDTGHYSLTGDGATPPSPSSTCCLRPAILLEARGGRRRWRQACRSGAEQLLPDPVRLLLLSSRSSPPRAPARRPGGGGHGVPRHGGPSSIPPPASGDWRSRGGVGAPVELRRPPGRGRRGKRQGEAVTTSTASGPAKICSGAWPRSMPRR
jgi:hypothetical protein